MDSDHRTFTGRNGTLIVGSSGVTVKRSFAQALSAGHVTKREIHIPYQHMERVMHHRSGADPGYLQFVTKAGTPGHSGMHRSRIHFGEHHAHDFRRAKELIDERVRQLEETNSNHQSELDATSAGQPMVNPFTGDAIQVHPDQRGRLND